MTVSNSRKLLSLGAFLLALVMMMSLFTVVAFADDEPADAPDSVGEVLDGVGELEADVSAPANDVAGTVTDTEKGDAKDEPAGEKKDLKVTIISWIIVVVIVAVIVVICVTKRDKVVPFFKGLKSESKKVVWTKREDVMKGTLVTLVVIAATFVVVGLLDFAFSKGIIALGNLF